MFGPLGHFIFAQSHFAGQQPPIRSVPGAAARRPGPGLNRRPRLSTSALQSSAGTAGPDTPADRPPPSSGWEPGFNEYLLGGVVGLTIFLILMGFVLYLLPGEHLQIPELQPAARVAAVDDMPVGSSRMVTWGSDAILVVRSDANDYHAVQGTSSLDGCILRWDPASLRIVSPCNYLVYDLHGNVVRGLTTVPLHRYTVFVRAGTVYVTGR